jgi:DNA-binding NarL/FixJ family response regulator
MIEVVLADDQALVRGGFRMILEAQDDVEVLGEAENGAEAVARVRELRPDVVLMDVRMPELDGIEATRRIVADGLPTRVLVLTTFDEDEIVYQALRAGAGGFLLKSAPPARLVDAVRLVAAGEELLAPSVTRRLHARHPDGPRVFVLTTFDLDVHAFAALKAGASGFLLKDAAAEDVLAAVRAVHAGDAVLAPSTTRRLVAHVVGDLPGPTTGPDPMAALTEREREVLLEVASGASNAEIAQRMYLSEATVKTHVGRLLAKLQLRDRVQAVVLAYEPGLVRPRSTDRPRGVPGRS